MRNIEARVLSPTSSNARIAHLINEFESDSSKIQIHSWNEIIYYCSHGWIPRVKIIQFVAFIKNHSHRECTVSLSHIHRAREHNVPSIVGNAVAVKTLRFNFSFTCHTFFDIICPLIYLPQKYLLLIHHWYHSNLRHLWMSVHLHRCMDRWYIVVCPMENHRMPQIRCSAPTRSSVIRIVNELRYTQCMYAHSSKTH